MLVIRYGKKGDDRKFLCKSWRFANAWTRIFYAAKEEEHKDDMVNKLYKNIAAGLKTVKPCIVYQEDVPEKFVRPYFLISISTLKSATGINSKLKHKAGIDITYVPEEPGDWQNECWNVGQDLVRGFLAEAFKIKNRNLKIVDQVLHFTFDADYREYPEPEMAKMQTMSQNTKMKED